MRLMLLKAMEVRPLLLLLLQELSTPILSRPKVTDNSMILEFHTFRRKFPLLLPNPVSLTKLCYFGKHVSCLICSDNESAGRTPLSKETSEIQPLIVAPSKDPVIDISDSPKDKRKLDEAAEASPSKKRKVSRKSRTASKLA